MEDGVGGGEGTAFLGHIGRGGQRGWAFVACIFGEVECRNEW